MHDRIPSATHLQFLVLGALVGGERAGREIRDLIGRYGVRRTPAAFYQMMARLERQRWIEGWYEQVTVGDQAVTERWYRLKPAGTRAWNDARDFYVLFQASPARRRWSDA
jgi:DNA-binding PadR family transcriptional regulator